MADLALQTISSQQATIASLEQRNATLEASLREHNVMKEQLLELQDETNRVKEELRDAWADKAALEQEIRLCTKGGNTA